MRIFIFVIQVHSEAGLTQPWKKSDILINPSPPVQCQLFLRKGLGCQQIHFLALKLSSTVMSH